MLVLLVCMCDIRCNKVVSEIYYPAGLKNNVPDIVWCMVPSMSQSIFFIHKTLTETIRTYSLSICSNITRVVVRHDYTANERANGAVGKRGAQQCTCIWFVLRMRSAFGFCAAFHPMMRSYPSHNYCECWNERAIHSLFSYSFKTID